MPNPLECKQSLILLFVLFWIASGIGFTAPSPGDSPANVLLITLDTTRADRLGSYGDTLAQTPNLDAIAARGVRMAYATAPTPLTLPSHGTIFTGEVPRHHGLRDNQGFTLHEDSKPLASYFKAHGYTSLAFISSAVLERGSGIERDFDIFDDYLRYGDRRAFQYVERGANQVVDRAVEELKATKEPWFAWVHFFDPHAPYVPPSPYRDKFPDDPYRGEIAFMDAQIGRLISAAESMGPLNIVVVGDHGESLGEHGEPTHGWFIYEATTRVPWLMAGQGLPTGHVVEARLSLVDLAPTLLEWMDLPFENLDGTSRLKDIQKKKTITSPQIELESFHPAFAYGLAPLRALIDQDWKFILAPTEELYDLETDPSELANLALREKKRLRTLRQTLRTRVKGDEPVPLFADTQAEERKQRLASLGYIQSAGGENFGKDPKTALGAAAALELGRQAFYAGNTQRAIEQLSKVYKAWPKMHPAGLLLSRAYAAAGDRERAIATARKTLSQQPDDPTTQFHLAGALMLTPSSVDDLKEAQQLLTRVLKSDPRHIDARLLAVDLAKSKEDFDQVQQLLEDAHSLGLIDPTLFAQTALMELKAGRVAKAIEWFDRAYRLARCEPGVAEALGALLLRQNKMEPGREKLRAAYRCSASSRVAFMLGESYLEFSSEEAKTWYLKALKGTSPGSPEFKRIQDRLRRIQELAP